MSTLRIALTLLVIPLVACDEDKTMTTGPVALNASSSTTVVSIPVGFTIQPSGKAAIQACVGETVTFAGDARLVAHQTTLSDGSVVIDLLHLNPQGAVAVGDVTSQPYRLVGSDNNSIVLAPSAGLTATLTGNLLAIGPGSAHDFRAHILQHITITSSGEITALIDVFDVECL